MSSTQSNSCGVRGGQSLRQLHADSYHLFFGQRSRPQPGIERLAGHQFTDQEIRSIQRIRVVDGLDRRMIQAGQNSRLIAEALARCFAVQRAG